MSDKTLTLLSADELRAIVTDAVREALDARRTSEGYMDTAEAAAYLGTTVRAVQGAVHRRALIPDHRGSRGEGLKGNRFSRATLDAFVKRKVG